MFTGEGLPRCSEGSLHPQNGWIQSGLQGQVVVVLFFVLLHESYENFPFALSYSKKLCLQVTSCPR